MLTLDEVEVRYGSVPAVRGLSLEVGKGEIVGLIGPNGAGKSTTLHAIMGLYPLYGGRISLRGGSLAGRAPEDVARAGIALVPEGRRIYADLTVDENLRLGLAGRQTDDGVAEDVAWVNDLFPIVKEFARRPAGTLSGGQQQQLAIARALVARPDVLLLDEPSLGLAPQLVDQVFESVAEVRRGGATVLLVEQNIRRTVELADRTYVLRSGRLAVSGTRAELVERELETAYLGL